MTALIFNQRNILFLIDHLSTKSNGGWSKCWSRLLWLLGVHVQSCGNKVTVARPKTYMYVCSPNFFLVHIFIEDIHISTSGYQGFNITVNLHHRWPVLMKFEQSFEIYICQFLNIGSMNFSLHLQHEVFKNNSFSQVFWTVFSQKEGFKIMLISFSEILVVHDIG